MDREDQIRDGDQLASIRKELGPLDRLLRRKKDDLFSQWANDETDKLSRDFCAGALSVIDTLMADIDEMIRNADRLRIEEAEDEAQQKELARAQRTSALEGGGYGDLAS